MSKKGVAQKCHHCMFKRMVEVQRKKIAEMEAAKEPPGLINPRRYILSEHEALLNDQPKCTCGLPADKKWTRPSGSSLNA